MKINRRSTCSHLTITMAMGALLVPLFASTAVTAAPKPAPEVTKSLLVMPVEKNYTEESTESFLQDFGRSLRGAVTLNSNMEVVEFTEKDPSVQRALTESSIRREDVKRASENASVTARIATELGADFALTTSVDEYTYDADKGTLSASVSCQVVDVHSKRGVKVVVSKADVSGDRSVFQADLEASLRAKLANKVAIELYGAMPAVEATAPKIKKKNNNNVIWWMLGAGVIAAVAGSSSGGGSGSGNTIVNPPGTP